MEHRRLGRSGLKVSAVGLGCNNFGRRCSEAETAAVVHKALDLGVTLFDTADMYGSGLSEPYLAQALGARRKDVVIATKFGFPLSQGPLNGGGSRRYVMAAAEASLKRLNTDYIDLYQLHFPDADTPIDETLRAIDDLIRQGKVRYAGASNFSGWQTADAEWIGRSEHLNRFVSAQNHYNLIERRIETDLVPALKAYGIGLLPYFPLANGVLTGKYRRGAPVPQDSRLGANAERAKSALSDDVFDRVEALEAFAKERGHSLLDLAFAWLLGNNFVATVIAGATKPEQIEGNVKAAGWSLSKSEFDDVARMTFRL